MDEHNKWLSRRAYHETFSDPGAAFPRWRGTPNRCNCGCAGVWHDRLSPINWWTTVNPVLYMTIGRDLVQVFLTLHALLLHVSPVIWAWLRRMRVGYMGEVAKRIQPGTNTFIAITAARMLLYGIIVPLTLVVWAIAWLLPRLGVILLISLYFLALILLAGVLLIPPFISVIAISMSGFVFILGGVGSIFYLDNPTLGIIAILFGVGLQYELQRRERRRSEEQLGYLILKLRSRTQLEH